MKMSVKKGHLMSEKELKEVVGGKPLEAISGKLWFNKEFRKGFL